MNHIQTAASKGMKAGYNQRKARIQQSGLGTIGTFADYCDKFGEQVTACKAQMRQPVSNQGGTRVVEEPIGVVVFSEESDELATLRQRIAELEAEQEAKASKPKPRKPKAAKNSKPKVNVWHPWAIRKHNIPTTVGATFQYKGKRRTSTFKVTKVTENGVESVRVA